MANQSLFRERVVTSWIKTWVGTETDIWQFDRIEQGNSVTFRIQSDFIYSTVVQSAWHLSREKLNSTRIVVIYCLPCFLEE
jgi:hypothetical protein